MLTNGEYLDCLSGVYDKPMLTIEESTKPLEKEICVECLKRLTQHVNIFTNNDVFYLIRLINDHFDSIPYNPPLEFEELEVGEWIWDNKEKIYVEIYDINVEIKRFNEWADLDDYGECVDYGYLEFEEGRYYRYEVKKDD